MNPDLEHLQTAGYSDDTGSLEEMYTQKNVVQQFTLPFKTSIQSLTLRCRLQASHFKLLVFL